MKTYVLRRVLLIVPTLLMVTIIVFTSVRLIRGDIVNIIVGLADQKTAQELMDQERARLGLDKPIYTQYFVWIGNVLKGDLGLSYKTKRPVVEEIKLRLPVTLELGIMALLFGILTGIPLGILSAIRQDTFLDYLGRTYAIGFLSIPNFWLGTMLILGLSLYAHWIPPTWYVPLFENPSQNLQMFVFPAVIMGFGLSAVLMRMSRTTLLEVLRQDYIRTAWAKGLRERTIMIRHAVKNALIPVLVILGLQAAFIVGGSVIMEALFGLPGVGRFLFTSIQFRDYPAIQAINLFLASFILIVNLLVDLSYGFLDPRIRFK